MKLSERMKTKKPFKVFFDVDDTIVKVQSDGNEVWGEVLVTGAPYAPLKASVEGNEISVQEAVRLTGMLVRISK